MIEKNTFVLLKPVFYFYLKKQNFTNNMEIIHFSRPVLLFIVMKNSRDLIDQTSNEVDRSD